jgi:glycine/serine hydroxymethyltransferase
MIARAQGQQYLSKIEDSVTDMMKDLLECDWIDIRPISGLQANQVAFWGVSEITRNRRMLSIPLEAGAHSSHGYTGNAGEVIGLEVMSLKYDPEELNIDVEGSEEIMKLVRPGIVTFGGSRARPENTQHRCSSTVNASQNNEIDGRPKLNSTRPLAL